MYFVFSLLKIKPLTTNTNILKNTKIFFTIISHQNTFSKKKKKKILKTPLTNISEKLNPE